MIKKFLVFIFMILNKMERIFGRIVYVLQFFLSGCYLLLKWQFWVWILYSNLSVKIIIIICVYGEIFIFSKKQEKNIFFKVLNEFKKKIVIVIFNFLNIMNIFKVMENISRELVLFCMFYFLCCMVNGILEFGIIIFIVFFF